MEYCCQGSLEQFIGKGNGMNESVIRAVLACSLLGLSYLYSKNITHGHIKPTNLFLSERGVIQVGDYGLSAQLDLHGCVQYMAPEVFENRMRMASDVWSLGISAIELAEGKQPFEECSQYSVLLRELNES